MKPQLLSNYEIEHFGFFSNVQDKLKEAKAKAQMLLIAPFLSIIKKQLGKLKIAFTSNEDAVLKFHDRVVKNSPNTFEDTSLSHMAPAVAAALIAAVPAVLSFFAALKKKKEQGEDVGKTGDFLLEGVASVETEAEKMGENRVEENIGETFRKYLPLLLIALVLIFLL